jgi:hypothetical protein
MAYVPPHRRAIKAQSPTATSNDSSIRHRALAFLAGCPDGCVETLLLVNGFTVELLVELVRDGLATATAERIVAGGETTEIARVRITEAGRRTLGSRS